eukprot:CAMPEP_0198212710 /NCGR_PEP_ID=MMETSP1445-20131203/27317_1 /TAXON_ID=36898 /ORGANISM="Pyramimonas sp., Strain CCMP2087" /LENGTH=52 /DNA_ID=CAMNT_0043887233 /DNA_START=102 /DNA_END=257 /DNA_ORIENTATION=+
MCIVVVSRTLTAPEGLASVATTVPRADDDNKPVGPTWAVGALSGLRDVFTST